MTIGYCGIPVNLVLLSNNIILKREHLYYSNLHTLNNVLLLFSLNVKCFVASRRFEYYNIMFAQTLLSNFTDVSLFDEFEKYLTFTEYFIDEKQTFEKLCLCNAALHILHSQCKNNTEKILSVVRGRNSRTPPLPLPAQV